MWSFGCILYELLKYFVRDQEVPIREFGAERFLFQGTSCYPLSPVKHTSGANTNIIANSDQMSVILRYLGVQSSCDLSFLITNQTYEYVKKIEESNRAPNHLLEPENPKPFLSAECRDLK